MNISPKPIFIVGPTAVGKTDIAIAVAEAIGAEIISADSMTVYRQMNIAVAKPTPEQLKKIPHHLIDVADIREEFTVARYRKLALAAIREIHERGKIPLIVGGTGLYIKALTQGLFQGPAADWKLRKNLRQQEQQRPGSLYEELERIDPAAASKLDPHDLRRIIRAIEVYRLTGKPISSIQTQWERKETECLKLGLTMERAALYRRIEQRCDQMLEEGLIEETRQLIELGIEQNRTAMQAIGYKELIQWLRGRITREQAIADFKTASRRLAKRQLTWFRKDGTIIWEPSEGRAHIKSKLIEEITGYLGRR